MTQIERKQKFINYEPRLQCTLYIIIAICCKFINYKGVL